MKSFFTLAAVALLLSACASTAPKAALPKAVTIALKGKPGETAETRYYSNSRILSYQSGQLLRDRMESVDFSVDQHTLDYKPDAKLLRYEVKTVAKDGTAELHDLAFPELGEKLEYTVKTDGEVLRVSGLPESSLFYVPSLPTPKGSVGVGDTWTMEHVWVSAKDGVPLHLQVLAILKDIVRCEKTNVCVELELSGDVTLVHAPTVAAAKFSSKLWGRVLFSLDRGDVIWSDMRSIEDVTLSNERLFVRSCMVSEMKVAGGGKIKFECDPNQDAVTKTPAY